MMYQIGRAEHPAIDDPTFDDVAQAISEAERLSLGDWVYVVWKQVSEEDFDVICLIYQGNVYRP